MKPLRWVGTYRHIAGSITTLNRLIQNEKKYLSMSPKNREKLEQYRGKYNTLIADQTLNLQPHERQDIINVIRDEWNPGYTVMEWCGHCVAEMVKMAFRNLDSIK